jgi:hypothetical protein
MDIVLARELTKEYSIITAVNGIALTIAPGACTFIGREMVRDPSHFSGDGFRVNSSQASS